MTARAIRRATGHAKRTVIRLAGSALAAWGLTACAATQPVRVLHANETRWVASVGGPLLPNSLPTGVLPYTTIGLLHGLNDDVTVGASLHALMLAFGVAGADVSIARRLRAQEGAWPELTGQAQLYGFTGPGGSRLYPNVTTTLSWSAGPRTLLYLGGTATVRPQGGAALVATPLLGVQRDVSERLVLQLEGKWMAANVDATSGLFEGDGSIGHHGAMALQLGLQWRRGGAR
ncbi:MAG: hypothetical protein HY275_12920 [Gemmatimonadetes bacterium]|nr:hypothetical protein [Gemmatimonadota bacterium]